jgi:rhodanese-related sulfurtransferase
MTTLVDRTEIQALMASGTVTIVDALPESYYNQQHLPGALNLVEADVDTRADSILPDKSGTIVTYCSNKGCGNSQAVANRLEKLGYTDVRKYADGIQDWTEAGLAVEGSVTHAS